MEVGMVSRVGVSEDFRKQVLGYGLTTAQILYRLPDHPSLLQTYVWQDYDLFPKFPRLQDFLAFWKEKLEGISPLELPLDYPRSLEQSTKGSSIKFQVEKEQSEGLNKLSKQEGATLFMTLLAALNILLQKYSGQEDISIGTPVANRMQQEIEGLVGFFVNTLALRNQVSGDKSFRDLLQQVKATMLEAYQHQEVPFEKVVEAVVKERDLGRTPLFQLLTVLAIFAVGIASS